MATDGVDRMSHLPRTQTPDPARADGRGAHPSASSRGAVLIVGAGPGSADLLTLRALDRLRAAEVVVHDRLVDEAVLALAAAAARRICVGKAPGRHLWRQEDINALLLRLARDEGRRVVRLKGGDPMIFGRGGEEVAYLRRAGVRVEIVPGVTAAVAAAAAAGIPLTHRAAASSITFVTGHGRAGLPDLDWAALARLGGTLAVYMGVANAGELARRLMAHGLAGATPVAVVEKASHPGQRVVEGELRGLGKLIRDCRIAAPALILIGRAVGLRATGEAGEVGTPASRAATLSEGAAPCL